MPRYPKGSAETFTFNCSYIPCGKEKTTKIYNKNENGKQFCSKKCFQLSRQNQKTADSISGSCKKCKKLFTKEDFHLVMYLQHPLCKECRNREYEAELLLKRLRQREFVKKWNELYFK